MSMLHGALTWTVLGLACVPLLYYAVAMDSARRWRGAAAAGRSGAFTPPVSVLKPVRGLDRLAAEHFASFCRQDYPDYEILFAVADAGDPAIPIIERLPEAFPRVPIRLMVGAPEVGASGKVNKLCRLAREARHDVLVVSDSDVSVPPGHLRSVVAPFSDPRVGAVTCLYRGISDGSFWSDLEAIGISTDFIPGVLVANRFEGMAFTLGATMATTRGALASIGGFEALADYCADDFELGRRLAARGRSIALAENVVSTESAARDGVGFLRHQLRWAVTLRHSRPWGYVGKIAFAQGLPWTLAAICVAPSASIAAAYALAYLVVRWAMAWVAAGVVEDDRARRKLYLVPVADAVAFGISIAALCSNRINWRGRWFELRKGRLVPADTSSGSPTVHEVGP
jgi:ceramide glucosyltransferase